MTRFQTRGRPGAAEAGFTLIELMIVVAIIAIVASIAIPNLIAARLRANESAAISVMRNVATAQSQFQRVGRADEDRDAIGEFGYLGELTGVVAVRGTTDMEYQLTRSMALVDANGEVQRSGYFYRMYLADASGLGVREKANGGQDPGVVDPDYSENVWVLYAWPATFESSGVRAFCISQRGDTTFTESAIYQGSNPALTAGAAMITTNPAAVTGLQAVAQVAQDGNFWRQVQ